jgi:CRP/FNR family transcriptional regulator, nitrogen oxide reductase regulator
MSDFVAQSRFLAGITAPDVQAMLAQATPRRFRANSIVIHQGAPATELFLITKGRARHFSTTPDGQKILLLWLPQGDIFGGATLLAERSTYRVSTETVKDTSVLVWSRSAIRALAGRYPRIMENAMWIASDYLDWYVAAHIALSCQTAPQRLAGVLVSLAPLLGRAVPEGVELDVTNEELASAAHITSFTASRLLNQWQRHRAVIKRRGKVVLLAPEQLVTLTA